MAFCFSHKTAGKAGFVFTMLVLCTISVAYAQLNDTILGKPKPQKVHGLVIDNETGRGIADVHVLNYTLNHGAVSDSNGFFQLYVLPNDTLLFTSVAHYTEKRSVHYFQNDGPPHLRVNMKVRDYDIEQLNFHYLGSYTDFKYKFVHLELPETKVEQLSKNLAKLSREVGVANAPIPSPSLASIPIRSKLDKERIRFAELLHQEAKEKQIYARYNKIIIQQLTGLQEPALTDFFVSVELPTPFFLMLLS